MAQQTMENTKTQCQDYFRQATENLQSAFETGFRFQQDAMKSLSECLTSGESCTEGRKQIENLATEAMNFVRKSAEQAQKAFDEGCKTQIEMLRKNADVIAKDQDPWALSRNLWQNAFDAMRSTVDAAARTTTQSIQEWSNFVNKNWNTPQRPTTGK